MKTEFGRLSISNVMKRVAEYREIGKASFLSKYANGIGSRTTWLSVEGELLPAKAIFAAAHQPQIAPAIFNTSRTYVYCSELGLELVVKKNSSLKTTRSAVDDLDELSGSEIPIEQNYYGMRFVRDGKVRASVLERANGKCEHCGSEGFRTISGRAYLETHHIISLSNQGPDSEENVIALCPSDHRRAHFGADAEQLEAEFKGKLVEIAKGRARK